MNLSTDITYNPFKITMTLTPEPAPEVRLLLEAILINDNIPAKEIIIAAKKLIASQPDYERSDENKTLADDSLELRLLRSDDLPFSKVCEESLQMLTDFCDKNPLQSIRSFIDQESKQILLVFMGKNITISYVRLLVTKKVNGVKMPEEPEQSVTETEEETPQCLYGAVSVNHRFMEIMELFFKSINQIWKALKRKIFGQK